VDDVRDVSRRHPVAAAVDPGELPGARCLDELRHGGRVVSPSHEARTQDDNVQTFAGVLQCDVLRLSLGLRVSARGRHLSFRMQAGRKYELRFSSHVR